MSDLEQALEAYNLGEADTHEVSELARAARRFANLTSPETIEKADKVLRPYLNPLPKSNRLTLVKAVLQAIREDEE